MSTVTSPSRYTAFRGQITNDSGLSIGHEGQEVADLQRMLKAAGFDPGPLDGKFGPLTQRALRAYQTATGERVDGTVELGELTRLRGNFAKITGEGFDGSQAGVNLSATSRSAWATACTPSRRWAAGRA